jgi:gluconolactonase
MKRIFHFLLILPLVAAGGYACTHKTASTDQANNGGGPGDNGGTPGAPGSTGNPGDGPQSDPADLKKNPIDGIAPATVLLDTGEYTDGPVWDVGQNVLFFTTPLGNGGLYRVRDDGSALEVRQGDPTTGAIPIGTAMLKGGRLVTFDAKRIMMGGESADAGAATQVANGYPGEGGTAPFDTLKNGVARADGTLYVTDPGFFVPGGAMANRIYRVTPQGQVSVVEAFEDVPRPNGVALSPDQKTLYVGFSSPQMGTAPYVRKYIVNDDGTLGEHANFITLDNDAAPDGIEVDQAGNIYVATKAGIQVFKSDASKIGVVAMPDVPTGMAFAGADLKTMYVTSQGTKIYMLKLNVPGIVQ